MSHCHAVKGREKLRISSSDQLLIEILNKNLKIYYSKENTIQIISKNHFLIFFNKVNKLMSEITE